MVSRKTNITRACSRTVRLLSKLPFRYATFYGNFNNKRTASEVSVMLSVRFVQELSVCKIQLSAGFAGVE